MKDSTGSLRVVFAGTPDFAASSLRAIIQSEHQVVGVYTQPDRKAGRGRKIMASPVKSLALEHDLPVFQPVNFKEPESLEVLASLNADLMVVVAYGLLLPKAVLETPRLGCINVHASLLPRWRGAAPIQRAIESGDEESGVTIMQMDEGLDTGSMLSERRCKIDRFETGGSLHDRLADIGATLLIETLDSLNERQPGEPQPEVGVTYAHKLSKHQAMIDWHQSAESIERQVRAFNPWPVATGKFDDGTVLRIWDAHASDSTVAISAKPGEITDYSADGLSIATGEGSLTVTRAQLPGKKSWCAIDMFNSQSPYFSVGRSFSMNAESPSMS